MIAAASYLLGSIPFGYLLVRIVYGEDVRRAGSGNIGATNVARKSPALGIITLLLDALKGSAAVAIALIMSPALFERISVAHIPWRAILPASSPEFALWAAMGAFFAVMGHMFPVWLKFRGGKGVATGLGSFLMLTPKALLLSIGIFLVIAAAFRFVSLGSVIAAASLPLLAILFGESRNASEIALIAAASVLIILKHHQNIRRLLSRVEPKFSIRPK